MSQDPEMFGRSKEYLRLFLLDFFHIQWNWGRQFHIWMLDIIFFFKVLFWQGRKRCKHGGQENAKQRNEKFEYYDFSLWYAWFLPLSNHISFWNLIWLLVWNDETVWVSSPWRNKMNHFDIAKHMLIFSLYRWILAKSKEKNHYTIYFLSDNVCHY